MQNVSTYVFNWSLASSSSITILLPFSSIFSTFLACCCSAIIQGAAWIYSSGRVHLRRSCICCSCSASSSCPAARRRSILSCCRRTVCSSCIWISLRGVCTDIHVHYTHLSCYNCSVTTQLATNPPFPTPGCSHKYIFISQNEGPTCPLLNDSNALNSTIEDCMS